MIGHDVLAIASDVRLARLPDRSLLRFAQEEQRDWRNLALTL